MLNLEEIDVAADQLKCGASTLRRWIKEGRIPALKIGRRVLIRREVLEEFVRTSEIGSKPNN